MVTAQHLLAAHQAGHFPGGGAARGHESAHCTRCPSTGSSSAVHAPAAPHAPASFRRCEGLEAGDDSHAESDFRQTRAVGGVPASVTRQRSISRRADKGQRDSSAPRSIMNLAVLRDLDIFKDKLELQDSTKVKRAGSVAS